MSQRVAAYGTVLLSVLVTGTMSADAAVHDRRGHGRGVSAKTEELASPSRLIPGQPDAATWSLAAGSAPTAGQKPMPPNQVVSRWGRRGWLRDLRQDAAYVLKAPTRIGREDLDQALLLATVIGGAFALDPTIDELVKDNDDLEETGHFFEPLGDRFIPVAMTGAVYAAGGLFNNARLKETGFMMAESYLITGGMTVGMKHLFGRNRPLYGQGSWDFDGPHLEKDGQHKSLVSGHVAIVFAFAGVLGEEYRDQPLIGAGAYTLAGLVGLHRVASQRHWFSDVVVGGLLGHWVGRTIVRQHHKRRDQSAVSLWYEPSLDTVGLRYTRRF